MSPLIVAMVALDLSASPLIYPESRRDETVVEVHHGQRIADPYRWLEDDRSEETAAWVKAQNQVTRRHLDAIPQRNAIERRLREGWQGERHGLPQQHGEFWFWSYQDGLRDQAQLMVAGGLDQSARLLLDPLEFSADGTASLSLWEPSEDGRLLVYGLSRAGSDWQEFRVRDVRTGKDLPDVLKWIKFSSASWALDGSGFYYSRFPQPKAGAALTQANKDQKIYFHRLGEPQDKDRLIYERPDEPDWGLHASVSESGEHLLIHVTLGTETRNRFFYRDLRQPQEPVVELLNAMDASYDFIAEVDGSFYFLTDLDAPRHRVIAIDLKRPQRAHWREIIAQGADNLQGVSCVGDHLICHYLRDARSAVMLHDLRGRHLREISLPGLGSAAGFGGRRSQKLTHYSFTSFTTAQRIETLEVASASSRTWRQSRSLINGEDYETRQVFVPSRDGTRVPLFLVHRRGMAFAHDAPTLLYGYGGFNISLRPNYSVKVAAWLEMGGVYAMANLRGGGEYGAQWHEAGTKLRKQNVFDDFLACARWLQGEGGITSAKRLAIMGGSNGGLLVGACMTQAPELFAAAIPAVGVMDMLRFERFTIGWAWRSDYGSVEDAAQFKALLAYSPLHQLRDGQRYPATLVTTADHDDRVVPAHSFKFAARLQAAQAKDGPPVLIRIETSAGHGAGTALRKVLSQSADELAFLWQALAMP